MIKNFDTWNKLKKSINHRKPPEYNDREIWWCSVGVNVGFEEDGKNEKFERPVLVYRKLNKQSFIGIPLTSVDKDDNSIHYMNYAVNGVHGSLIISQLRLYSSSRLNRKMAKMIKLDFKKVSLKIQKLLFKGESPSG